MIYDPKRTKAEQEAEVWKHQAETFSGLYTREFKENKSNQRLLKILRYKYKKLLRAYNKLLRGVDGTLPLKGRIYIYD